MALYHKFFLIVFFSIFSFSSCFSQNVTFNSQADVDAFSVFTTSINGSLTIESTSLSDPIADLSNLSNLTSIGTSFNFGGLTISSNEALTNIDGLAGLISIEGNLRITTNNILTNLEGLANLISIGQDLTISSNDVLLSLGGLINLTTIGVNIGGGITINGNDALTSLYGLSNITSIEGILVISNNNSLIN